MKGIEMTDNNKKHANVIAECEKNRQNELLIRQEWLEFIQLVQPQFFVTVTFKEGVYEINGRKVTYDISDKKAVALINKLLYFVNSSLFRKRHARGKDHLKGFVVIEYQSNGNPHSHFLITNDISLEKIETSFRKNMNKVVFNPHTKLASHYHPFSERGFDIQEVYSDDVIPYILKDCDDPINLHQAMNLEGHETALLTADGIQFQRV
ncbi:hypothetical protein BOW50_11720 [Solemya velum gill symbiont]|uniref:hypothetical protein n=1 Tax=Solemya velum gill symbiont TaxID=2340 RepID=UPI000998CD80|nr:hypothetical protein [Solemya velum gill symbiont]OOZ75429.1 hypothetical protein BOW50_11720 [Solemya velum gill symbiont]